MVDSNELTLHLPIPRERFLPYLSTSDVAALPKDDALVVLPIASIEQHGPHLPLVSDTLLGQSILGRALEQVDPNVAIWVLPNLAFGKSNEHRSFPGTMTLSAATLEAVIRDVADGVAAAGFRRLALVNSHGGNPAVIEHVSRDVREATGLIVFPLFMFRMNIDYGNVNADEAHWGTHGSEWETSALLALAPELVQTEQIPGLGAFPTYPRQPRHLELRGQVTYAWLTRDLSHSGALGNPELATAEHGQQILDVTVARLAEVLAEMATFEMPIPPPWTDHPKRQG